MVAVLRLGYEEWGCHMPASAVTQTLLQWHCTTLPSAATAAPGLQPSFPEGKPTAPRWSSTSPRPYKLIAWRKKTSTTIFNFKKKPKSKWYKLLEINTNFQASSSVFAGSKIQWQLQPWLNRYNAKFFKYQKCALLAVAMKERGPFFILSTFPFKSTPVTAHLQNNFEVLTSSEKGVLDNPLVFTA